MQIIDLQNNAVDFIKEVGANRSDVLKIGYAGGNIRCLLNEWIDGKAPVTEGMQDFPMTGKA